MSSILAALPLALLALAPRPAPVEDVFRAAVAQAPAAPAQPPKTPPTGAPAPSGAEGPQAVAAPSSLVPPSLAVDSPAMYPGSLLEERIGGSAELLLSIDEAGLVTGVELQRADHPAFGEAAVTAAAGLRFTPATLEGEPVAVRVPFSYNFAPPPAAQVLPIAILEGRVRAQGTRQPIANAVLHVAALPEPVPADADGSFSLTLPPGLHQVCVTALSHSKRCFDETLEQDQKLEVRYALMPDIVSPYETVVRGERERVEVSSVRLRGAELRDVPGTMGDPFRVVMLMPGVASIGSGIAYPVVRGTQPAATGYYIDGVRVPALFHMALGPSVVHPEFLDGINFYPGAPPARFGRLLGGVIEGRVSRPREDRIRVTASVDLINAGAYVEVPIEQTGTSITLAGRYSYTGWLIASLANLSMGSSETPQPEAVADFADYQARIEQRLGPGRLRLLAFGASDTVGTRATGPKQFTGHIGQNFHRVDLRWEQPLAGGQFEFALTGGKDQVGLFADEDRKRAGEFSANQLLATARAGYRRELGERMGLELGAEMEHRRANTNISLGPADLAADLGGDLLLAPQAIGNFGSIYGELVWRPADRWTVTPGLRLDTYKHFGGGLFFAPEPRVSVRHALNSQWTLKGGVGLFHQQPTVLLTVPVVDVSGLEQGLQRGLQIAAGAEWKSEAGLELSADAYYNPLLRSVEFNLEQVLQGNRRRGTVETDLSTHGRSYGFELLARHPLGGNWFGWVSYSFNRSLRHQRFARFDENGNPVGLIEDEVTFAFEQTHVLNAAVSYQLPGRWTVGATVHFNTGRPESGDISSRTSRVIGDPSGSDWAWFPQDRDRVASLPTFWRLDARVAKDWVFENWTLQAYLDFFNVSFSKEILGYMYNRDGLGQPSKEPLEIPLVVPMLGLKGSY